jgi:drug/metabolite transporter (DMT)-like permease
MTKKLILAHIAMFIVALIYALNFAWAKLVMPQYIGAYGFILLRVSAAVVLFFISSLFIKQRLKREDMLLVAISGIFGVALNMLSFFKGLELTTPINGALIMLTTPILVLLFSLVVLKEKLTFIKITGIILGLSGALILIYKGQNMSGTNASNPFLGNILVAVNAASYGIYLIMIKPLTSKYHPVVLLNWTFFFGLLYVIPFGASDLMKVDWQGIHSQIWWIIAFVLVCVTFLTYLLNGIALTVVSPAIVGAYIYLQPLLTGIIAIIGGHDMIHLHLAISALLIFVGVYFVSRK